MATFPANYLTVDEVVEAVRRGMRGEIKVHGVLLPNTNPYEVDFNVMMFGDMEVTFEDWGEKDYGGDSFQSISSAALGSRIGHSRQWRKLEGKSPDEILFSDELQLRGRAAITHLMANTSPPPATTAEILKCQYDEWMNKLNEGDFDGISPCPTEITFPL